MVVWPGQTLAMTDGVEKVLLAKQVEITNLIDGLTAGLAAAGQSANRSRSDRYGLASDRHSQVATLDELRRQSQEIKRALTKVGDDTYGVCDVCGEHIAPARLEIRPWAVVCVACAD